MTEKKMYATFYRRSVTAAQWLSGPSWGLQPLSSGSIPDAYATNIKSSGGVKVAR